MQRRRVSVAAIASLLCLAIIGSGCATTSNTGQVSGDAPEFGARLQTSTTIAGSATGQGRTASRSDSDSTIDGLSVDPDVLAQLGDLTPEELSELTGLSLDELGELGISPASVGALARVVDSIGLGGDDTDPALVQALLAGNAVVAKGSEVTPFSSRLAATLFSKAGLPEGVFQVLLGDGETGAAIVNGGVDKVSFTGSVATGRKVAEACASQLIPCTLELGGNDAMIVCADADLDRAADGAWLGSCMNTGHYCCGTERIYVVEQVYDEFLQRVLDKGKHLRQGQQYGWEEDIGAVFWDRQLAIIEAHVEDARAKGANILMGGRRNPELPGLYYEPTVITGVDNSMDIMRLETFGPILCIQKVAGEDEAIALANDSEFGLNGNVWTQDKDKGYRLAAAIDTGSCSVNDMAVSYGIPAAPFGGRKHSGLGQVNGKKGLRGYCHEMPIVIDRFGGKMQNAYPYSAKNAEGMKKLMDFLWVKTPLGRWLS